jgi:hypothetical protein
MQNFKKMKTYYDNFKIGKKQIDGILIEENTKTSIPKDLNNHLYRQILEEVQNGQAQIIDYIEPQPVHYPVSWSYIREVRDERLKETDWVMFEDANPQPSKQAWLDYRQALRDIPQNYTNTEDVVWPVKPA